MASSIRWRETKKAHPMEGPREDRRPELWAKTTPTRTPAYWRAVRDDLQLGGQGDPDAQLRAAGDQLNPMAIGRGLADAARSAWRLARNKGTVDDLMKAGMLVAGAKAIPNASSVTEPRVVQVPALRVPVDMWQKYRGMHPDIFAAGLGKLLRRGYSDYGYKVRTLEGPFLEMHEPSGIVAKKLERLGSTEAANETEFLQRFMDAGVYDLHAYADDLTGTDTIDLFRKHRFLPLSSLYFRGTKKKAYGAGVNPFAVKTHFTDAVPAIYDPDAGILTGPIGDKTGLAYEKLVNFEAPIGRSSPKIIVTPETRNVIAQPVLRESQTTTEIGNPLGGGRVVDWSDLKAPVHEAAKGGDTGPAEDESIPEPGGEGETPPPSPPAGGGPRIVINPSTFRNEKDALCVAFNEAFRLVMEEMGFNPVAEPTEEQRRFFADTAYADDETQMRRTILARICTFDTSVKDPTDEQLQEAVEFLTSVMEAGAPQNEWEQQAVMRLRDVIAKTAGAADKGAPGPIAPAAPQGQAQAVRPQP